jgi:BirA family biotin operon repressor/biotin-[acetyl-CoA-carboxylase] ligase
LGGGVADAGRLLLDAAGGRVAIVAGDVSLRVKE